MLHSRKRRESASRCSKLRLEGLESRRMLTAENGFAHFSGWIDSNETEERLSVTIAPEHLSLGKDRANLSFHVAAVDGDWDPAALRILDAGGNTVKPTLAKQDLPGSNDSFVVALLPAGQYTLVVSGEAGSKGKFALNVGLVGDANGDHKVDRVDGDLIKAAFGSRIGGDRFLAAADVDRDGRIGSFDLMQWQLNSADTAQLAPQLVGAKSLHFVGPLQANSVPLVGGTNDRVPAIVPTDGYRSDAPMRFYESEIGWVQPLSTPTPTIASGVFPLGRSDIEPQSQLFFSQLSSIEVSDDDESVIRLDFEWEFREAGYNNSVGYYLTDASGNVGGISPTNQAAYKAAVQSVGQTIFSSGQTAGATKTIYLPAGSYVAFYLVQDGNAAANWWFSIDVANADAGYVHFQATGSGDPGHRTDIPSFKVEDLRNSDTGIPNPQGITENDADFNDVVFSMAMNAVLGDMDAATIDGGTETGWLREEIEATEGVFIPLNDDDDDYDGFKDLTVDETNATGTAGESDTLKIVLNPVAPAGSAGLYFLDIPANIRVWLQHDRKTLVAETDTFAANVTTTLWVEGIALGTGELMMKWKSPDNVTFDDPLDTIKFTVFKVSGPRNVPNYSQYTYGFTGATPDLEGPWAASGGTVNSNADTAVIHWGAGPAVGYFYFEATPNYNWRFEVNIVEIVVAAPDVGLTFAKGTPGDMGTFTFGEVLRKGVTSEPDHPDESGLVWKAKITLNGPMGHRDVEYINVGFVQNLINYRNRGTYNTVNETLVSNIESLTPLLDADDDAIWYDETDGGFFDAAGIDLAGDRTKTIGADDTPRNGPPLTFDQGDTVEIGDDVLDSLEVLYAFQLDISATTDDVWESIEVDVFTRIATAAWSFAATSGVAQTSPYALINPNLTITAPDGWTLITDGSRPIITENTANQEIDTEVFNEL